MSALLLLVYATQLIAGCVVLRALDPTTRPASERLARALLLGPAAIAVQMLLLDAAGLRWSLGLLLSPWWILGAWALWRRRAAGKAPAGDAPPADRWRTAALLLALLLFGLALVGGQALPVHTTDAMNNFALLARVYQTHGSLAPEAVRALQVPGHVDYPPLVPLNEAALFLGASGDLGLAIKPFFALAQLALLLLVVEACWQALRGRGAALAAAFAMLVPMPGLMALGGYADTHVCAAVLLVALQGRELLRRPTPRGALLYAACVGTCALVKFEGLALALPAALLPWLVALRTRGAEASLRAGPATAAVALALLVALAWPLHLLLHALGDPPGVGAGWHDLGRALQRWPIVARSLLGLIWSDDDGGRLLWGLSWPVGLALAAFGLLRRSTWRAVAVPAVLLLAHLGFYVTVLALSPFDLGWHVGTAGPRFLLHAAPWLLLAALAALEPRTEP